MRSVLVIAVAAAALALASEAGAAGSSLRLVRVASGFDHPVHATAAPGDARRIYVVEQDGVIRVRVRGIVRAEPFLDIRRLVGSEGWEQGLLSVAFHPDYATNRLLYVNYTNTDGDTEVVEFRSDGKRALPATRRLLMSVSQPYDNHNGGGLAFGPDGLLYVGTGDGGGGGDPGNRAQDLASPLGKLFRIDPATAEPKAELVAYGLRNPWRYAFDTQTGDLWIADVGQRRWEEIDVLPAGFSGLANFGWDVYEGKAVWEPKVPNPAGSLVAPLHVYGHPGGNCSVTGGYVYHGRAAASARGRYFYGDYCSGVVWSLRPGPDGKAAGVRREPFDVPGLVSFGETWRGGMLLVSHEGTIYRLAGS